MYQNLYHDLALTITELSRSAADELEHENSVYQKVLLQRNTAADELHRQLPKRVAKDLGQIPNPHGTVSFYGTGIAVFQRILQLSHPHGAAS